MYMTVCMYIYKLCIFMYVCVFICVCVYVCMCVCIITINLVEHETYLGNYIVSDIFDRSISHTVHTFY